LKSVDEVWGCALNGGSVCFRHSTKYMVSEVLGGVALRADPDACANEVIPEVGDTTGNTIVTCIGTVNG
jgi:hypothetical protein